MPTRRGLVYTASAERYADEFAGVGVRAAAYHAGMRAADRESVHERFQAHEADVVVATSALGMGIDTPDVRFVVHVSAPDSLDSYYQQVGRAGRDGEPARITLHYCAEDLHVQRFLTTAHAPDETLVAVAGALAGAPAPMRLRELPVDASAATRPRAASLLRGRHRRGAAGRGRAVRPHRRRPPPRLGARRGDVRRARPRHRPPRLGRLPHPRHSAR